VVSRNRNLLEAGEGAQHGSAEHPPLDETDVAQNARFGTITDQRGAESTGDRQAVPAAARTSIVTSSLLK
jgi:hypothetical protein